MVPLAMTSTKAGSGGWGAAGSCFIGSFTSAAIAAAVHYLWKVKVLVGSPVYYAAVIGVAAGLPARLAAAIR